MIKYYFNGKNHLFKEEHVDYVQEHYKESSRKLAEYLKISQRKVYDIRKYIRYEILKLESSVIIDESDNEVYRKIPSLLYLYEITDYGKLRNVKSKRIIKGTVSESGHYCVSINNSSVIKKYNKPKKCYIHKLVMEVWGIPCPFPGAVIHHIDRNPKNNNINNLKWVTIKENVRESDYTEFGGRRLFNKQFTVNPWKKVRINGKEFDSYSSAARWIAKEKDYIKWKRIVDRMHYHRKNILGFDIEYLD